MRDYDLTKYHMQEQMRRADNARLAQATQRPLSLTERVRSLWSRSQTASHSNTGTAPVPAHRLEPTVNL